VFALGQEWIQEARGTDVVLTALGAPLEQPAMLEEHVHQLPEHVVGRLDELLADERVGARRLEHPLGAELREGDRQAASRAGRRDTRLELALRGRLAEGDHDVIGLDRQLELVHQGARFAGQPERRQCALSDDHRMDKLDRNVAHVRTRGGGEAGRDQTPAAGEPLGHAVTEARDPLGLGGEEGALSYAALLQAILEQLARPARRSQRAHATAWSRRCASSASHARSASTPSPVFALHSIVRTPGLTVSML
jgi:hypothetical protein